MVVLNRIYTRTGDDGTTALGSGERRPKYDLRIAAYGTVDETNAAIGMVRLYLAEARDLDAMLCPSARARRNGCGCWEARSSGSSATSTA
jgi:cob(I)alamin adenosyltransferase